MRELRRVNKIIEQLKIRLAQRRMTYHEAVTVDHLISVFERIQSRAPPKREADYSDTPMSPKIRFHPPRRERAI